MENLGVSLTNIAAALLFIGLCIPFLLGKIKMNTYYGIRFSKSFQSTEAWDKINRFGARQMLLWSSPLRRQLRLFWSSYLVCGSCHL